MSLKLRRVLKRALSNNEVDDNFVYLEGALQNRIVKYLDVLTMQSDKTQVNGTRAWVNGVGLFDYHAATQTWVAAPQQEQPASQVEVSDLADDTNRHSSPRGLFPTPWFLGDQDGNLFAYVNPSTGTFRALLDQLPGLPYLGGAYRYLVQSDDRLAYALTHRGGFVGGGEPLLDGDYRITWSQAGDIVFGQRHDGSFDLGTGLRGRSRVYTKGAEGERQVYVWNEYFGELRITDDEYDNWAPELVGGDVQWLSNAYGSTGLRRRTVVPAGPFASQVTQVVFSLASGQSLVIGAATWPMTTEPPAPDRLVTFNHGVRRDNSLRDVLVKPWEIEWLIPGVTNFAEVPLVQQSAMALLGPDPYDENVAIIAGEYGRGGTSITELSKGSTPYQNGIRAAQRAKYLCDQQELEAICPAVTWIQGEADREMAPGEYTSWLMDLQADYDADLRAIFTAQTDPIKIITDQFSSWTAYDIPESVVPFEQLEVALTNPDKFLCAGPKYQFQHATDGVHMTSESSRRLGAKFSEVIVAAYRGEAWLPTYATKAERTGSTVTLTFHTPHEPLVLDTTLVSDPGDYGIRWIDAGDGNAVTITSITVQNDNTVTVELSDTPTGTEQMIGIADIGTSGASGGPSTGPRSCLRDSSPRVDLQGNPIFNWACHQRVPVTTI